MTIIGLSQGPSWDSNAKEILTVPDFGNAYPPKKRGCENGHRLWLVAPILSGVSLKPALRNDPYTAASIVSSEE